jgi:hypothetical protein
VAVTRINRQWIDCSGMSGDEPLIMRTTVIAGSRYADDYAVA